MVLKIVALISGKGTNLRALLEACRAKKINAEVCHVISNNKEAEGLKIAEQFHVPYKVIEPGSEKLTKQERASYDLSLGSYIDDLNHDLVFCLGWIHIFSESFLNGRNNVINLHPALPGCYPGMYSIRRAYDDFNLGKIRHSGVMVHFVIPKLDAGEVILRKVVSINNDTYEEFENNMRIAEKDVITRSIRIYIEKYLGLDGELNKSQYMSNYERYKGFLDVFNGKVRDKYNIENGVLAFVHSDRLSAFDKYICDIIGKGVLLNYTAAWWFERTKHIIGNHYISHHGRTMITKKCSPIKIEVIVRGYITGSSETSLWTLYKQNKHGVYGIELPEGLKKDQKLDEVVVTPTTKDEHDEPLSSEDIIERGLLERHEWEFVRDKALELYKFGAKVSNERGLILVDTKYEFGFDGLGNIILIDEVHTCDSSRYWILDEYVKRFNEGRSQKNLDKDHVRRYLVENHGDFVRGEVEVETHNIPIEIKDNVLNAYLELYNRLCVGKESLIRDRQGLYELSGIDHSTIINNYFNFIHPIVVILAGSKTDADFIGKFEKKLWERNIHFHKHYYSAHRNTLEVMRILEHYNNMKSYGRKIVFVTVAGKSNALSGVVGANVKYPVFAFPPFADKDDQMLNINSTLQMPRNVPTMTVLDGDNLAICIERIFDL